MGKEGGDSGDDRLEATRAGVIANRFQIFKDGSDKNLQLSLKAFRGSLLTDCICNASMK